MTELFYSDESELQHHGIMGQKWGERRFQNLDGTLTEAGKKRYAKVASSERLTKKHTKLAKKVLKSDIKRNTDLGDRYRTAYNIHNKKANKFFISDEDRIKEQKKAARYQEASEKFFERTKVSAKKLADIDAGTIKAGKDFIVQTDVYWYPFYFTKTRRLIEK